MACITVYTPERPPLSYRFEGDRVAIGRASANDLVVHDPAVSRIHVELRRDNEHWTLVDRGSRHGTLLNDQPLDGPRRLRPGDTIVVGDTKLVFEAAVPGAEPAHVDETTQSVYVSPAEPGIRLVGSSDAIRSILATIEKIAPSDATVLITGDSGTGKELVARLLHARSRRASEPLTVINCPALPGGLLEAELFGIERGVATGVDGRPGRLETARGGTLLLDEIGDLDPKAQAKLLRFLENKTVDRLGSREPVPVDVRILAATNHDLEAEVERGAFRADLYHRLNTLHLTLPPLRARREDIGPLVDHFLSRHVSPHPTLSPEALELLQSYDHPGNVRELEHIVERALLLAEGAVILPSDLPEAVRKTAGTSGGESADSLEKALQLHRRMVRGGESFWDVVHRPFLSRELSREVVRCLVAHAYREAGGTYRQLARLYGIEPELRKLLNFLYHHDLQV